MCSTVNAPDSTFCAQCGARVRLLDEVEAGPGESAASPAPAPPAAAGGGLGWLGSLRGGEEAPAPADSPAPPPATPAPPSSGGRGWLGSLRGGEEAPAAPAAGPTAERPAAPPAEAAPPLAPAGGLGWLASLRGGEADTAPEPEEPAEPEISALPAWLQGTPSGPEAAPPPSTAGAVPSWLEDLTTPEAAPPPASTEGPGWLAGLRPAEPAAAPPPAAASAVPPWLQEVAATPAPLSESTAPLPPWLVEAQTPAAPADAELPSWMSGLRPAAEEPAAPSANLPAWLNEASAAPAVPEGTALSPAAEPASSGLPAWLEGAGAPSDAAPAPPNLTDDIELPAWLRAAGAAPPPTPMAGPRPFAPEPEPAPEPPFAEVPPEPPAAVPGPLAGPLTPGESSPAETGMAGELLLPAWLEGPPPVATTGSEPDAPTPVPTEPAAPGPAPEGAAPVPTTPRRGGTGLLFPAWLEELSSTPEPAEGAAAESALIGEEDLPAWLRALQPSEPPPVPTPAPPPAVPTPAPEPEALPEWLQALAVPAVEEEAPPPTSIEEFIRGPVRVVRARPPRTGAVETFLRVLQPVRVAPPAPAAVATRRTRFLAWLLPDGLIYLLLLLVVAGAWGVARGIAPDARLAAPNEQVTGFHRLIVSGTGVLTPARALGSVPGLAAPLVQMTTRVPPPTSTAVLSPALVVFDWDASRYGEMSELSRAVVRDLVAAGRPFASVSLVPQGPGFADQIVGDVDDNLLVSEMGKSGGGYGDRYINLGYRPGNEAAIRTLSVNEAGGVAGFRGPRLNYDYRYRYYLTDWTLTSRAISLSDYGMVILLVSEESDLRLWIEQLTMQTATPLVAAVPVSLRASVTPYLDPALAKFSTARLAAALFGVQDALRLEQARLGPRIGNPDQERLTRLLHTQSATLFAIGLLLLAGIFYYLYRWMNRPKPPPTVKR